MQKQDGPDKLHRISRDLAPGEFGDLLREIEREAVPERLLELARQLQAALVESRRRQRTEGNSSDV